VITTLRLASVLCCALMMAPAALAQEAAGECTALSASEAPRIRSIRVMSAIPQDDVQQQTMPMIRTVVRPAVGAAAPSSSGLLGAIIGHLIVDAMINTDVKKRMEEAALAFPALMEQVKDFDFRAEFWTRLDAALGADTRFRVLEIKTFSAERSYVEQPDTVRGEPIDAVLDLRTQYALSADLRAFVMTTEVLLQARPDGRELYRCEYSFVTPPASSGNAEAAIAAWAAQEGALYRAAAVIGMEQTLKILRLDLTGDDAPRPSGEEIRVGEVRTRPGVVIHAPVTGYLVNREGNLIITRDAKGRMRAAMEAEAFAPSPEMISASTRSGSVELDELLGVMSEDAPAKKPAASPATTEGLLRD
jgi:hypothetical protein